MYAVEFRAKIKDGIIQVPQVYWERLRQEVPDEQVRVILLMADPAGPAEGRSTTGMVGPDRVGQLLANPLRIPDFKPSGRDEIHEQP